MIKHRIEEAGVKRIRKDSVKLQDAIVTATPEWLEELTLEEQKEFFRYALEFFKDRYGEENFISATVHMDEATPHMHFDFVPITKDGRLSSKEVIGGPVGLSKLQDEFYAYMVKEYPDLDRGVPRRDSHREHLPTKLYKEVAEVDRQLQDAITTVGEIGLIRSGQKKAEAMQQINEVVPQIARIKQEMGSNEEYVSTVRDREKEWERKCDYWHSKYNNLHENYIEEKRKNEDYEYVKDKYRETLDQLESFREKYYALVRKLRDLPREILKSVGIVLPDRGDYCR